MKEIILPNDPCKALLVMAELIDKINIERKIYPDGADKRSFTGFSVPLELLHDLHGMSVEARRVVDNHSAT